MPIDLYPNIAKIKRDGVYQNLPGFVQQSSDADIKAMIANSEINSTAQYAHPEGSYFILNDVLYKAILDIAVNDTIAVGTNCEVAILSNDVSEIENDIGDLNDMRIERVVLKGNNLIPSFEQGDIYTSGNNAGQEYATNYYFRTPAIPVNSSSIYLATVTKNTEGTPVRNSWTNTTYCLVCCYSDSAFLGVASPAGTGIVTLIEGTTYIRISHILGARTADLAVYENNFIYPSGNTDIVETQFNTNKIENRTIIKDKLSFLADANSCIATKDDFAPWYVNGTQQLISSLIPFSEGSYIFNPIGTNINFLYVGCFDENKEQISRIDIGSTNFGTICYTLPSATKYINCALAISSGVLLSKLTSLNVYRRSAKFLGFNNKNNVININDLPSLPPLALTGQACGGIASIGHGGVSSIYAEDSIESFYALAKFGYSGSEVDIQFTADHVPVCWHNPNLSTLTGGTANDHIYDYTLAELDANFDFSSWWDNRNCFRKTVARFEEVCVLARAYGWTIMPDKMTSASGSENADNEVIVAMLKKYKLDDKLVINRNFSGLREAFPNAPLCLSAMESSKDDEWMNSLLNNTIPSHCHTDSLDNLVVDDDYVTYTAFNWLAIKRDEGINACIATNELCDRHNVKLIWYTVETPEDIYQLVSKCPSTAIALTGLYTIPDGMNQYLGLTWSNTRYGLNKNTEI